MNNTILIVDNETHILKACQRVLRSQNYTCRLFSSPEEALERVREINPSVVLSDQQMPGIDGISFLERVKTLVPMATRILMTGYADIESVIQAINKGHVFRFIKKPWDDKAFCGEIRKAVDYFGMKKRLISNENSCEIHRERLQGVLEMAGAVCHEFAQPLQIITGYCGFILSMSDREMGMSSFEDHLLRIHNAAGTMGDLLSKVMSIQYYKTKPYLENSRIIDIEASSLK